MGVGAETPATGSGVMGTAPPHCVEEVEEEDPDVPLKRRRDGRSRRKRVVKKPHRYAPTVVAEGELPAAAPPPAPLATKSLVPEPTTGKAAPDLGKISFVPVDT